MSAEPITDELIHALAKRLFRAENPPDLLWDDGLLIKAGLPLSGYRFASAELKSVYIEQARAALEAAN